MTRIRVSIIVVIIACIHPIQGNGPQAERQILEIIGSVVAYDQLVSLTNLTSAPQSEVLLVTIAKQIRGQEVGAYIKIVYTRGANEPSLPQEMFDGRSQWHFILKRDERCDTSSAEMKATKPPTKEGEISLPRLKFTSAVDGLVDNTFLPCYSLKPGDYRALPMGSVASRAKLRQNSKLLTLRVFPVPESHTYQFTRKHLSSMEDVKNDREELAALFKIGDRQIEDLIRALDDPDREISIRAQIVIRYLGNDRGVRKLIEWYDKRTTEYPIAGPIPLPLSDWDYEFINRNMLGKPPETWREIGITYIYALAIDYSERNQRVLNALVKNASAVSQDTFLGQAINEIQTANRGKLIGGQKDLARLVLDNAFFVSQWDKKHVTARLLGFNGSKDKALIEVYINRGPLAEEWYHVVIRRRDLGWKFFSITQVAIS